MLETLYMEGCSFVRHYSSNSLSIRNAALVQGFLLLSACGYLVIQVPNPLYPILVSLFGLVLTFLLYVLHFGYLHAADVYAAETARLELRMNPDDGGPITGYQRHRDERHKRRYFRIISIHAPFTALVLPFLMFLAFGIVLACG